MAAILTNGVLKIPHRAHLSAAVGAGALQGLWEHKGSRCTPANAAHSPPRRSPAPARARHAAPDGQAHSQPTDQPPSPPTGAGAASSQQSPPASAGGQIPDHPMASCDPFCAAAPPAASSYPIRSRVYLWYATAAPSVPNTSPGTPPAKPPSPQSTP